MSVEEMNVNVENEMVKNLMGEGFGDPLPDRCRRASREVTVATVR